MSNEKYFSRSWALITHDKGWFKPLLVMTAASLVPVAGMLGIKGYVLEWARLVAWGVDASPKQKNVDVGKCIGSGWRAFVVDLGLGLAYGLTVILISTLVSLLPGVLGSLLSTLVSLATLFVSAFAGIFLMIAEIRTAIYERIGAGYRVDRIVDMIKADVSGFGKLFLIAFVCAAILGVAGMLMGILLVIEFMPVFLTMSSYDESAIAMALAGSIVWIVVTAVILGLVMGFLGNGIMMVEATATALWMRQFDVPSWGRSEDPLPSANGTTQQRDTYQTDAYPTEASHADQTEATGPAPVVPIALPESQPIFEEPSPTPLFESDSTSEPVSESMLDLMPEPPLEPPVKLDAPVKDVDRLYADLQDVIQRNDRTVE